MAGRIGWVLLTNADRVRRHMGRRVCCWYCRCLSIMERAVIPYHGIIEKVRQKILARTGQLSGWLLGRSIFRLDISQAVVFSYGHLRR
jgi:hypothetical protein